MSAVRFGLVAGLVAGMAGLLTSCGSSRPGLLTNADIPRYLGVHENPAATKRAPGGAEHPAPFLAALACPGVFQVVFTPPEKVGVPFEASGKPAAYPTVVSAAVKCGPNLSFVPNSPGNASSRKLSGIGDKATLFDFSDTTGYPNTRAYLITWQKGATAGEVGVQGPDADARVTLGLVELLAHRAVARS